MKKSFTIVVFDVYKIHQEFVENREKKLENLSVGELSRGILRVYQFLLQR